MGIASKCNPVQYQGKLMMQTWENGKNPNFECSKFLLVPSHHPMQVPEKLTNQRWENGKKPNFGLLGPNFGPQFFLCAWILPPVDVRHCYKLSLYAISRKTNEPNMRKWQKKLISGPILVRLAQIRVPQFFWWVLPQLDVRH